MQLVLSLKLKCGDKEYYSLPAILSNCYKMMIVLSVKIYSVHYDIGLALLHGWSTPTCWLVYHSVAKKGC